MSSNGSENLAVEGAEDKSHQECVTPASLTPFSNGFEVIKEVFHSGESTENEEEGKSYSDGDHNVVNGNKNSQVEQTDDDSEKEMFPLCETHLQEDVSCINMSNFNTEQELDSDSSLNLDSSVNGSDVTSANCELCHMAYRDLDFMVKQPVTDTAGKVHICQHCKRTFRFFSRLISHHRMHTGEKPYVCSVCKKTFSTSELLQCHHRTHTGEKPYTCQECGKSFAQKSHLNVHNRSHLGIKPYKCDLCQKEFTRHSNLVMHARIHSGEKPFKCDLCKNIFSRKGNLVKHIKRRSCEKLKGAPT